ncbi:MAG TPA: HlyD family efflux transporter periplasmic adaptor subunit, partial [Gammaproteobacteria bacterium]|nr:HlyD family efflux transporter periplasmic adaptor subunit [Gammaproteobacteria bacterium]
MKNSNKILSTTLAALFLSTSALIPSTYSAYAQETHAGEAGEHGEEGVVEMNATEREKNGVITAKLTRQTLGSEVAAPGEIALNQYKTSYVTSRIAGQISKRHARLGQHVKRGAPLVTLTSVELAGAQGEAIVAHQEWQRVKALGTDIVAKRRYVEAEIAAQLSQAKIAAFGMTPKAVDRLLASGDASKATGIFTLYSGQSGTVMKDSFVIGELIEPGRVLFEITDESTAWVNVKVSSDDAEGIEVGASVRIKTGSGYKETDWKLGKVLQLGHQIDESTRTFSVRVEMDNKGDNLHAGQFVTAFLQTGNAQDVLAAPADAITFMQGQNIVFVLEGDKFLPTPV